MCFRVTTAVKQAKKDIPCYKIIRRTGYGMRYDLYIDGHELEPWEKGFHYTETDFPKDKETGQSISGDAFHSYIVMYEIVIFDKNYKAIKCYIPKGAWYYENIENNEYCSSDIVYEKDL